MPFYDVSYSTVHSGVDLQRLHVPKVASLCWSGELAVADHAGGGRAGVWAGKRPFVVCFVHIIRHIHAAAVTPAVGHVRRLPHLSPAPRGGDGAILQ